MIKIKTRICWLRLCIALGLVVYPLIGSAQLVQNLMVGNAKALALGNAVTADPPGVDAIHFNPAGLVRLHGTTASVKVFAADIGVTAKIFSNPEYEAYQKAYQFTDPLIGAKSEIDKFAVYLPDSGITELPVTIAPVGGFTYQLPGSSYTFGTAVYTPIILGYTRTENDPGRFFGESLAISRITFFSPTFAFRLSDTLSLGMGVNFSYVGLGVDFYVRNTGRFISDVSRLQTLLCEGLPNTLEEVRAFCAQRIEPTSHLFNLQFDVEEKLSIGYNFGLLWEPYPWLSFGMTYQDGVKDRLKGVSRIILSKTLDTPVRALLDATGINVGWPDSATKTQVAHGYIDLPNPAHVALGTSVQVLPNLKVNFDIKWTQTSDWTNIAFINTDRPLLYNFLNLVEGINNGIFISRDYEDTINWGIGVEYQYNDNLALRAGYEPRKTGIPDDRRDHIIPFGDFDLFGLGVSYQSASGSVFDLSLGYAKIDEYVPANTSGNGNRLDRYENLIYNPLGGLDVQSIVDILLVEMSYEFKF